MFTSKFSHGPLVFTSGSNSGIACTGVDASPNTMERALIRESNSLFRLYCKDHNIPIRPCGSIVCLWPWDDDDNGDDDNNDGDDNHGEDGGDGGILESNHDTLDSNNEEDDYKIHGEDKKEEQDTIQPNLNLITPHESPLRYISHDSVRHLQLQQKQQEKLSHVYNESYDANDTHVQKLSSVQIQTLEPNISPNVIGGVHIPGEIVVDPWLYSISLAVHARENGAEIYTNCTFDANESKFDVEEEMWNVVVLSTTTSHEKGESTFVKKRLRSRVVVNAAGLWSDTVQKQTIFQPNQKRRTKHHNTPTTWTAKPRRGQYRIYKSNPTTSIQHPIQPIPTQRTKGIFIYSSFYNHIVVGPTALDQTSKTDTTIDPNVAHELDTCVQRVIPNLHVEKDCIGEYVGIRPGTDKRDYQIHLHPKKNWMAVAGIRSTGLTASLGIGNYVVRNLHVILDEYEDWCKDDEKDNIDELVVGDKCNDKDGDDDDKYQRTKCRKNEEIFTTPMPSIETLMEEYQRRDDGMVTIHGFEYKVTHPLTKLGWSCSQY